MDDPFIANAQAITAAGGNPTAITTELTAKKELAVTKGVEHENLKTALKNKSEEVRAANQDLDEAFSNRIDSVCGTIGKKSHLGRQIARVRTKLRSSGTASTPSSKEEKSSQTAKDGKAA